MKFQKLLSMICLFLAISSLANAQTSKDEMIKEWERAKTYTKEYLDAMPESGYALKPTPEMRSFAEQMLHLTDGNYGFHKDKYIRKQGKVCGLRAFRLQQTVTEASLALG